MSLVAIEDLRLAVNVGETFNPERLPQVLAGAESWIRGKVRRKLEPWPALVPIDPPTDPPTYIDSAAPVVHRVVVNGSRFVRVPDAREITRVTVDDVELAATDYELHAHRYPADGPTTHLELLNRRGRVVEVTGRFGFAAIPDELREAILTLAARRVYEESIGLVDSVNSDAYGARSYVKRLPVAISMVLADLTVPDDVLGL